MANESVNVVQMFVQRKRNDWRGLAPTMAVQMQID